MKHLFRAWPFTVLWKLRYAAEAFWKRVVKKTFIVKPKIASASIANRAVEDRSGALDRSRCHLPAQSQYHNPEFRKNRLGEVGATQSLIVIECIEGEFVSTTVGPYAPVRKSSRFAAMAALIIALAALTGKLAYDGIASNSISSKKIATIEKLQSAAAVPSVADNLPGAHEVSRPVAQSGSVDTTDVAKNHIPSPATTLGRMASHQTVIDENVITEPTTADKQKSMMEVSSSIKDGFSQHITGAKLALRNTLTGAASTNSLSLVSSEREPLGNPNVAAGGGDKNENTVNVVRHKTGAHSKRSRESSGTTVIGRIFSGFAKQFSTDLRRLPRQISSMFER